LLFGSVKGPKGLTDEFYGFIRLRKRSIFVIESYLKERAFTAVKGYKVLNKVCEKSNIYQWKVNEKGTFFAKNSIQKG